MVELDSRGTPLVELVEVHVLAMAHVASSRPLTPPGPGPPLRSGARTIFTYYSGIIPNYR